LINKAILIGNLGRDPETSYSPAGMAITRFSIATTESWKDKATGERISKTEWHNVVAFGKLAEICGQYLCKGKQVYVEGRIQTSSWEKDGVKRYKTDIVANVMQMLGSKSDEQDKPPETTQQDDDIPF